MAWGSRLRQPFVPVGAVVAQLAQLVTGKPKASCLDSVSEVMAEIAMYPA